MPWQSDEYHQITCEKMANAGIVDEGVRSSSGPSGNIFAGKKFWFNRIIPQRKRYIELVESNGGTVVSIEKQADIRLTDHARKGSPPDTYSYKYVEESIRNGKLEDLEDHRVGPPAGAIRPVGATHIPAKRRRTPFTAEDDRILLDWVRAHEEAGGRVGGNLLYEQLQAKHPHHTSQSWRSRYITLSKVTRPAAPPPPPPLPAAAAESTEPRTTRSQRSASDRASSPKATPSRQSRPRFTAENKASLLQAAENIMSLSPSKQQKYWDNFAKITKITSEEWQAYFNSEIRPEYLARKSKEKAAGRNDTSPESPAAEQSSSLRTPREGTSASSKKTPENLQTTSSRRSRPNPSFEPESPSFRTPRPVMSGALKQLATNARNGEAPSDGRSTKSPPQGKRKRDDTPAATSSHTSPETKRVLTSAKRRQTTPAIAVAVEIPPLRRDTTGSRDSLPSSSRGPSAQLLSNSDSNKSTDVEPGPKSPPRKEPSRPVSSSHSNQTHQTDQFEDAPQYQEEKEPTPGQDPAVNLTFDLPPPPSNSTDNYMENFMKELPFPLPAIPSNPDETSNNTNTTPPQQQPPPPNEKEQTLQTENWITSRLKSKKASNEHQLILALRCCSMEPNLADKVLKSLRAGEGIPGNMKGVWTAEDDRILYEGQSREIERLLEKHGDDFYQKRVDYFRLLSEVGEGGE